MNDTESASTVLVVFGASGDLMSRKIVPALLLLHRRGLLPARFRVVGFSRREWDDERLRRHVAEIMADQGMGVSAEEADAFLSLFAYQRGTFEDAGAYSSLAELLAGMDESWGVCSSKLFYLAVPPENYRTIFDRLAASGLTSPCSDDEGWTRVLVEKPFGKDAETARELDAVLGTLFREEQVYRIDHYLAKEMLQGVLNFRFINNLFESAWSAQAIERIDIFLHETLGVEARGAFYDGVGALRDVGQNHLLQMLALVTMEQPGSMGSASIREARARLLRALRKPTYEEVAATSYRAQYDGYLDIEGVEPDSDTETYFRLGLSIDDARWRGVPISIESGKRMGRARKEIVVTFRHPRPCLCSDSVHRQNRVVFALEPTESIRIDFWAKKPGLSQELEERSFDFFLYEREERAQYVEEYAKLLLDGISGDQTLFVSTDEVASMWETIDPVLDAWERGAAPLERYAPDEPGVSERAAASVAGRVSERHVGVVGLGKMGTGIARNLRESGWHVVGYNRSGERTKALVAEGIEGAYSLRELARALPAPRIVWVMVPAGDATEAVILGDGGLADLLEPGDIVIDGGNSLYKDSARRARLLGDRGIGLIDVGTSGGPSGARSGACLMAGGNPALFPRVTPLLADIARPGGFQFFEGEGAGHFVKMVHNGIEYGMMQAIAEGFSVMREAPFDLDLSRVADVYQHGSVIESRLIGWLLDAFDEHGTELADVSGSVGHTGEGQWTVEAAKDLGVEARVIEGALEFRRRSERDPSYAGRVLTALRSQFGGHALRTEV